MIRVPIELGRRRYDVLVGSGVRRELARAIRERLEPQPVRAAVVTQDPVRESGWLDGLDPGVPFEVFVIGDGEAEKSLSTVETLCRAFASFGLGRADVVVAVGGGVVTDVAGFAAASYHRGVAYVNVATTLLAQVDAAIGGKTAVDLPEGKNLVGAFWQPSGVLCDTETLTSLPHREWVSGRGELAKYAFLGDAPRNASLLELSLDEQVARCVRLKAAVVVTDERETQGQQSGRAVLNYGHTLAHALEAEAFDGRGNLVHGEAVAVGLYFAALLSRRLGRIDEHRVEEHRRVIGAFGLDPSLPAGCDPEALVALMARDKKARGDLTFVLDGPSGVEVVRGVGRSEVLATLAEMRAGR